MGVAAMAARPFARFLFLCMLEAMQVRASLLTDVGRVRPRNQDSVLACEPADRATLARSGRLYIVADGAGGVGGPRAGVLASRFAAHKVQELYYQSQGDTGERLRAAMLAANDAIRQHVARPGRAKRMATTMVAAVVRGTEFTIAHVGDSRAYLLRDGQMRQLTEDHSLVAGLLADGAITPEEAADHPQRNIILHSLGSAPHEPRVDVYTDQLQPGDTLLLCTDGLTRYADSAKLQELLAQRPEDKAAGRLIGFANAAGGGDNISAAVLRIGPKPLPRWVWWVLLLVGIAAVLLSGLAGLILMMGV